MMKTTMKMAGLVLVLMLTGIACGNRSNQTDTSERDTAISQTDTTVVLTGDTILGQAEPPVSAMELSVKEPANPCGPGDDGYVLTIKGGIPFEKGNAYRVAAAKNDYGLDITHLRYTRKDDATIVRFAVVQNNLPEEGATLTLRVTDSADHVKTVDIYLDFCL